MRKEDTPQHKGVLGKWRSVCYAVDEKGGYSLESSAGWDPVNLTNEQAWEVIARQVEEAIAQIAAGNASPLAYHMARNQMDVALLASYTGVAKWRVRRHLKPHIFRKLSADMRERYARVFAVPVNELGCVPETFDPKTLNTEEGDA